MRRLVVLTFAAALTAMTLTASAVAWTWPVDGQVIRAFSMGDDPYAGGQHRGVDIAADSGSSVRAPVDGTVSFAGTVPGSGRTVTIRTEDGYAVTLVGLGSIAVAKNALVSEGETVGTVAPVSDESTPASVHLGVRIASDSNGYLDPLTFLPARTEQPVAVEQVVTDTAGVVAGATAESESPVSTSGDDSSSAGVESEAVSPTEQSSQTTALTRPEVTGDSASVVRSRTTKAAAAPSSTIARPSGGVMHRPAAVVDESGSKAGDAASASTAKSAKSSSFETGSTDVGSAQTEQLGVGPSRFGSTSAGARSQSAAHSRALDSHRFFLPALLLLLLGTAGGSLAAVRAHGAGRPPRMMLSPEGDTADDERKRVSEENPGCGGLAVCQRPAPYWARRRVRRPVRHLRPLSPAQRQRRVDGEWHRRARDTGHGRGRERRALIS